jgi:DNA polymerase-3 subunit epsilon
MKLFSYFFINYFRNRLLKRKRLSTALKSYLSQTIVDKNALIKDVDFLVLDFETTGLYASKEKIVSIGYTVIKNLYVVPSTSTHILVNPKQQLIEKNVSIHQLTDSELKHGLPLSKAIDNLLVEMAGKVVIVHFDKVERSFINQSCRKLYKISRLPVIMLDTLKIEQKKMQQAQQYLNPEKLRLHALRQKYNLPRYKAHNAMQDSIATAELFLAQIDHIGDKNSIKLNKLM